MSYRYYKNFDNTIFKTELQNKLDSINNCNYLQFETTFMTTLEKHAPLKKKIVRANNVPYMSKTLRKAIMKRSEIINIIKTTIKKIKTCIKNERIIAVDFTKKKRKNSIQI